MASLHTGPSPAILERPNKADDAPTDPLSALQAKLQWLMLFRVLMVTVLLGSTLVISIDSIASLSDPFQIFLYGIIIGTYLLTLLYAFLLERVNTIVFAYFQLAGDVVVSGSLVFVTGGTESVFTFLFSLSIINGAILLFRKGALTVATFSTAFFGLIVAHEYGLIPFMPPQVSHYGRNLYYVAFIHFTTFYLVAILASYLAEQLQLAGQKLEEKQHDIDKLKALNINIVNSLSSGLLTVADTGRIIFFNAAAALITGYTEADVLYRPLADVFPELGDVLTFAALEEYEGERFETLFTRDDNARIFLEYQVSPLKNHEGKIFGKIVHFRDLTETKTLESAVRRHERLAAVGQLASAMAHEIRNPLASISGSAQVLGAFPTTEEREKQLLDIVVRETDRLNELITDFLSFARPNTARREPTDLGWVVSETIESFRMEQEVTTGPIEVAFEADISAWAFADGDQIRQVLWNLLNNAAQAMPEGGKVTVKLERRMAQHSGSPMLYVHISDQGVGVPKEIQDKIFDPFYTTRSEGTGLGLAVVQRILNDHDGEILIRSDEGAGATFSIRLPAAEAVVPGAPEGSDESAPPEESSEGLSDEALPTDLAAEAIS